MDAIEQQPELHRILTHARNFSEVIHGVRLLYNFYLAEKALTLDITSRIDYRDELQYCVEGNLQAVVDEYVHLLAESLRPSEALIEETTRCDLVR